VDRLARLDPPADPSADQQQQQDPFVFFTYLKKIFKLKINFFLYIKKMSETPLAQYKRKLKELSSILNNKDISIQEFRKKEREIENEFCQANFDLKRNELINKLNYIPDISTNDWKYFVDIHFRETNENNKYNKVYYKTR
jgi:hypothetical protein